MKNILKAMILGCGGTMLTTEEKIFFRAQQPWGFILFGRNIESLEQVRGLVSDLRASVGREAPVFIDQEGGTVRRLRPPLVRDYPSASKIGALYTNDLVVAKEAAWACGRLMAADLIALGINVNCAPVLDMPPEEGAGFIASRSFSSEVDAVIELGQAMAGGLKAGGVFPVMKHMPGHGRGLLDSHKHLPVVDAPLLTLRERDFRPFKALNGMLMAMTCHVVFEAVDNENPASTSKKVVQQLIRDELGFDGLVISDDISMNALSGTIAERACAVVAAGVDLVLHCNGDMVEMKLVADAVPSLDGAALVRAKRVDCATLQPDDVDLIALRARFDGFFEQEG